MLVHPKLMGYHARLDSQQIGYPSKHRILREECSLLSEILHSFYPPRLCRARKSDISLVRNGHVPTSAITMHSDTAETP